MSSENSLKPELCDMLPPQGGRPSPLESQLPEGARRLAYLRQIEQLRRSDAEKMTPYPRLASQALGSSQQERGLHKPQAPRRASSELAAQCIPAPSSSAQRHQFSFETRGNIFYQACEYFRSAALICLGLFLVANVIYVSSVFALGHPSRLPEAYHGMYMGVYQGFNCGWSSEVSNPYTCR